MNFAFPRVMALSLMRTRSVTLPLVITLIVRSAENIRWIAVLNGVHISLLPGSTVNFKFVRFPENILLPILSSLTRPFEIGAPMENPLLDEAPPISTLRLPFYAPLSLVMTRVRCLLARATPPTKTTTETTSTIVGMVNTTTPKPTSFVVATDEVAVLAATLVKTVTRLIMLPDMVLLNPLTSG